MKKDHGILQPLQCISCSKRYSNYQTLGVHRREFCKGKYNIQTGTYTLSSFIRVIGHWTPTVGEKLACICVDDGDVVVLYDGRLVGDVPKNLSRVISTFLQNGTIHARIAGTLFDRGYGLELPVDFIFNGTHREIHELLENIEKRL